MNYLIKVTCKRKAKRPSTMCLKWTSRSSTRICKIPSPASVGKATGPFLHSICTFKDLIKSRSLQSSRKKVVL